MLYLRHNPPASKLPAGTVGAIAELRVSVDLLSKGYEVFRALNPSCPCDLAILCDNRLFRVEVRTAHRSGYTGKVYCDPSKKEYYDILAQVLPEQIVYIPELILAMPPPVAL